VVLSTNTGSVRPYMRNPYEGYEQSEDLMFPVNFRAAGFHPKERVLGIKLGGEAKAYPFVELGKAGGAVADRLGGMPVTIRLRQNGATGHGARCGLGRQLPAVVGFWFAWYAFNPTQQRCFAPRPKRVCRRGPAQELAWVLTATGTVGLHLASDGA
jgi:hypothetical protein